MPIVRTPVITRLPPTPYTRAVAREATSASAVKKTRFAIAILTPMSRTRPDLPEKSADSSSGRPNSLTSRAPATLKRSVICVDMSAFSCICSRVICCSVRPIQRAGTRKIGSRISEATVICHDRNSIATTTATRLIMLPTTPESVEVNACCAPITSLLRRETSAPVWARVKKATGMRCTWSNTWVRRS